MITSQAQSLLNIQTTDNLESTNNVKCKRIAYLLFGENHQIIEESPTTVLFL